LKSIFRRTSAGFTLLELIIAMTIFSVVATVSLVSGAAVVNLKRNSATSAEMQDLDTALTTYYRYEGLLPTGISDSDLLAVLAGTLTTEDVSTTGTEDLQEYLGFSDVARDGWGRPILVIEDVSYNSNIYAYAFLSQGSGNEFLTTFNDSTRELTIGNGDVVYFVSIAQTTAQLTNIASLDLERLTAATLTYYNETAAWPDSITDIWDASGIIRASGDEYLDPWNNIYNLDSSPSAGVFSWSSNGSDLLADTDDDQLRIITVAERDLTLRGITAIKLAQVNGAISAYEAIVDELSSSCSDASSDCILDTLLANGDITGSQTYDGWGQLFIYDTATQLFISLGAP
jgi:prepilin-type N-terminal cleavage/methylation domain-containing protein